MTLTADGSEMPPTFDIKNKCSYAWQAKRHPDSVAALWLLPRVGHYIPRLPKADRDCYPLGRCIAADEEARAIRELPTPANLKDLR